MYNIKYTYIYIRCSYRCEAGIHTYIYKIDVGIKNLLKYI